MSSTRHVKAGEPRRQNGWASSPEYDVLRGLNGTAVALKAALQDDPKDRLRLYALLKLSLREGGLKRLARELLEMFPERIGTPTMHRLGCKPGKQLTEKEAGIIRGDGCFYDADDEFFPLRPVLDRPTNLTSAAGEFYAGSRERCEQELHHFLEELGCDPKMQLASGGRVSSRYQAIVSNLLEDARDNLEDDPKLARERPDLVTAVSERNGFRTAEFLYFGDVLGAIDEYLRRYRERVRTEFVETGNTRIAFDALDYALETGRSALLEGHSGYGKTTGLKAWCEMHLGQAIYVQLAGITSRGALMKRIADACGVANGDGYSTDRIQARVEAFFKRTKLMLVIDEGQYLWPQGRRITSHPDLINWINTALYNENVPYLISATSQFTLRRQAVEKQTDWSSEQSRRRTRRVFRMPDLPLPGVKSAEWHKEAIARVTTDLQAVARKQLGALKAGEIETAVDWVVGYALTSRGYFQAITDAVDDARLIAKRAGRDRITFKDLECAVEDWRATSDATLIRVFDSKTESRRQSSPASQDVELARGISPAEPEEEESSAPHSRRINHGLSGMKSDRRATLLEAEPALTS